MTNGGCGLNAFRCVFAANRLIEHEQTPPSFAKGDKAAADGPIGGAALSGVQTAMYEERFPPDARQPGYSGKV